MTAGMAHATAECTNPTRPCRGCLTSDRRMYRVGSAADVFTLLASTASVLVDLDAASHVEVCWECYYLLQRIRKFRTQLISVDMLLRSVDIDNDPYKTSSYSLSSLRSSRRPDTDYATHAGAPLLRLVGDVSVKDESVEWESCEGSSDGEGEHARPRRSTRRPARLDETDTEEETSARRRRTPNAAAHAKKKEKSKQPKICAVYVSETEMRRAREELREAEAYTGALFRCESCILGFSTQEMLSRHISSKHAKELGPYECDICLIRSSSTQLARAHRQTHYRLHACPCGVTLRSAHAAAQHYRAAHAPAAFLCKLCGRRFPTDRTLRYHRECEHKEGQTCQYCSKRFNNSSTFKRHLLQHTGMPMHECPVCHKSYRGAFGLRAHARTHRAAPADGAYCAECGAQFKNKYLYRHHLRTSARHAPPESFRFPCTHCDKRFFVRSQLRAHVDSVHLRKDTHKCEVCGKGFATVYRMRNHARSVHEQRPVAKTHICETCGRAFATKQQVIRHQPIHTGERPYSCDICEATFRQSAALYTHRRLVHLKVKKPIINKLGDVVH